MPASIVLCYHSISPSWPTTLAVTPDRLRWQLRALLRRGYYSATFFDVVSDPRGPPRVAVTFDDAYRSVGEHALPILHELGMVGTVFAPTDHVGTGEPMSWPGIEHWAGGAHRDELIALNWAELRRLAAHGWEIGSHTCSHARLTQLDPAALTHELRDSRSACETHLDRPCRSLAYPYGDVDDRVAEAAGRAGFTAGAAMAASGPLRCPRIGVYPVDAGWRFQLKLSRSARRLRAAFRPG